MVNVAISCIGVDILKNNIKEMLIVGMFTAFMGQVHFYPFGTDFRITVGVILFTFLLLYFHTLPIISTSIATGVSVLLIRVAIDVFGSTMDWDTAIFRHIPALMYYISYGLIIERTNFRKLFDKPVYFIIALTSSDIVSNFFELLIRDQFTSKPFDAIFSTIMLAAILRSCIVLVLFWIIKYYSLFITKEEHQKRYKELLLLTAKLKSEIFFLKKSMQDIEGAMAKSYSIYNLLKESDSMSKDTLDGIMRDSLNLSIDIHEIKKDYNRIVISMEKLLPAKDVHRTMKMSEIFETIEDIYIRYLEAINRDIKLSFQREQDFSTSEHFIIMSILNNMIQNSIEASYRSDSFVKVSCALQGDKVVFQVEDNGKGIKDKDKELIFEPGYTTKFNPETGQVSTGLGLTHIKMLTEHLDGNIWLKNTVEGITDFVLEYPVKTIICEGDCDV